MQMSLQPPITSTAIETTNPNSFSRLVSASTMANQVNLKGISKESQRNLKESQASSIEIILVIEYHFKERNTETKSNQQQKK